ncbi:MAG: SDR family oxidoreductase [Bacilli bacterium]|nr:SDR family oxidoreductase [Bacilli bacterium]
MKALITGASSGIGRDIAYYLASKGYDLILVARREDRLKEVQKKVSVNTKIIPMDLSIEKNVYKLYDMTKDENIDMLVNNAGFAVFGFTSKNDIDKEIQMMNVNINALYILTRLFLNDFIKRNSGYILNVGSSAGFLAGPKLNTYYATKNFVVKFTLGLYEELKHQKSNVHVSVLCPGPVETEFNKVGGGHFNVKALSSEYVAKYAIDKTLKNKYLIIPGITIKMALFFNRFLPYKLSLKVAYTIQDKKTR